MKSWIAFYLTFFLFPTTLAAGDGESYMPGVGRLIAAFVIVIALIYVSVHLLKRITFSNRRKGGGVIRFIDSYPLHQKARLSIVEVAGRAFLISVTDHQVSTIAEYDPSEFDSESRDSRSPSFVRYFNALRGRGTNERKTSVAG